MIREGAKFACCDANIDVRLVSNRHDTPVRDFWKRLAAGNSVPIAPSLFRFEVTNVLYRIARANKVSAEELLSRLDDAFGLGVRTLDVDGLHHRAARISDEFNLPAAYDAHYLALAESLECPFYNSDAKLVRAAGNTLDWVHLV